MELHRDGAFKHAYVVKPAPRTLDDFFDVIADSFRPSATFLNALCLTRFRPGEGLLIHNLTVVETRGSVSTARRLRDRRELVAEIEEQFGIPAEISADVLHAMENLTDVWD
jgi:hypothetical protein